MNKAKLKFVDMTREARHKICRMLAPKLCENKHGKRPFILFLKELGRKNLVGVEIGVARGDNALSILHKLDMKRLYLIDNYLQGNAVEKYENYDINKRIAIARLGHRRNVQFVFEASTSTAAKIVVPPNLDFVYIDGDHSFIGCLEDIKTYWKKVKSGGYIGGHDFYGDFRGVINAVQVFCALNHISQNELKTKNFDWWIKKP